MMLSPTFLQEPRLAGSVRYVPAFTGIRAVAAYLVFLHHHNPASVGTFAYGLFAQGYIGVSIFFVLSGFMIYHRYADTYFTRKNWSWRIYLQNRFARIFPLYALLLLVTVGMNSMLKHPMNLAIVGLNVTLLKGFFDIYKFSGIPQSWSLTVEACFYLLAPFLFICLRRWGAFRLTTALLCTGLFLWATIGHLQLYGLFGSLPFLLFYTFFGRSFEFVMGMWLAQRWHTNQLPTYRFATFGGLFTIGVCVLWQTSVAQFAINPVRLFWSEVLAYNYLLPVGIGLFFMGLLDQRSICRQLLSQPIIQALGHSSYAFYLIHIGIVANGLQKYGVTNSGLLFGSLVLIACGLYATIEKPLQHYLRSRYS